MLRVSCVSAGNLLPVKFFTPDSPGAAERTAQNSSRILFGAQCTRLCIIRVVLYQLIGITYCCRSVAAITIQCGQCNQTVTISRIPACGLFEYFDRLAGLPVFCNASA